LTPNSQRVENAVDYPAVVTARYAKRLVGQNAFDGPPFKVAHIRSGHFSAPCCSHAESELQAFEKMKNLLGAPHKTSMNYGSLGEAQ
jgi:hypothetical protein